MTTSVILSVALIARISGAASCRLGSFPSTTNAVGTGEVVFYDMTMDAAEEYAFVAGYIQNIQLTGENNNKRKGVLAKFSTATHEYVWFKNYAVTSDELKEFGVTLALSQNESQLATVFLPKQNTEQGILIAIHETSLGRLLTPFYLLPTELKMVMNPLHGVATFDSSGFLWVVHMTKDATFGKGFTYITKLKIQNGELAVVFRQVIQDQVGAVMQLPGSNHLLLGGSKSTGANDEYVLALYALDHKASSLASLTEIDLYYNYGDYWLNDGKQRYIDLMDYLNDASGNYLFFVTETTEISRYGRDGAHLACRAEISSSFPFSVTNGLCFTHVYSDTKLKVNVAIEARDKNTLNGFSAGFLDNQWSVFWKVDFSLEITQMFHLYENHQILGGFLSSRSQPPLSFDSTLDATVMTGFVVGNTKNLILDFDGVAASLSKTSGLITSLRIGEETCGTMTPYSAQSYTPVKQVLTSVYGDVFFPSLSAITTASAFETTLTLEPFSVYDLDYNQVLRNPSCDVITPFTSISSGAFNDITLYKDVGTGFPLSCPVQLPSVADSCTGTFNSFFIDQSLLPTAILSIDPTQAVLVFEQPLDLAVGDYPVTVNGFLPQSSSYAQSSFTFTILVREALDASVTQRCGISCSDTQTSQLFIRSEKVEDMRYTYGEEQNQATFKFEVSKQSQSFSEHPDCSEADIVYSFSIEPSSEELDSSFITVAGNQVSWFREENQNSGIFIVKITAKISLTALGQVVTRTEQLSLSCTSVCGQSTVYSMASQEFSQYTVGDGLLQMQLVLFDTNNGACIDTFTYQMVDNDSGKQLGQQLSLAAEVGAAFNPQNRTLSFFADTATRKFIWLSLVIFSDKTESEVHQTLDYRVEVLPNNAPRFAHPIAPSISVPCDGDQKSWFYALPEVIDDEGDQFSISLEAGSLNFAVILNQKEHLLQLNDTLQMSELGLDGEQPASITLWDQRGGTRDYRFFFELICKENLEEPDVNLEKCSEDGCEEPQEATKNLPEPRISTFTQTGNLILSWNVRMRMLPPVQQFEFTHTRTLLEIPNIDLTYIQNSDGINPSLLDFSCTISWLSPVETEIRLSFKDPSAVSSDIGRPDKIVIRFNDTLAFVSEEGQPISAGFQLEMEVPRQFSESGLSREQIAQVKIAGQNTARAAVAMSVVMKAVANTLLSLIQHTTLIIHMFSLVLPYPVSTQKFFQALFPMVAFDLFPADLWVYEPLWGFDSVEPEAINLQFEDMGYENMLFIMNMGSLFFLLMWIPLKAICITIAYKLLPQEKWWPGPQIKQAYQSLPNEIYTKIEQTYLIVLIMTTINLLHQSYANYVWSINSAFAVAFFLVYLALPVHLTILYAIRLRVHTDAEESEKANKKFIESHGALLAKFRLHRLSKLEAIALVWMKFVYQAIPVLAIFVFLSRPMWSVVLFLLNELVVTCLYLHLKPFTERMETAKFMFERFVTFVTIYHLFLFTDFVGNEQKNLAGISIVAFIFAQIVFMVVVLVAKDIATVFQEKSRKKYLERNRKIYREQVAREREIAAKEKERKRSILISMSKKPKLIHNPATDPQPNVEPQQSKLISIADQSQVKVQKQDSFQRLGLVKRLSSTLSILKTLGSQKNVFGLKKASTVFKPSLLDNTGLNDNTRTQTVDMILHDRPSLGPATGGMEVMESVKLPFSPSAVMNQVERNNNRAKMLVMRNFVSTVELPVPSEGSDVSSARSVESNLTDADAATPSNAYTQFASKELTVSPMRRKEIRFGPSRVTSQLSFGNFRQGSILHRKEPNC